MFLADTALARTKAYGQSSASLYRTLARTWHAGNIDQQSMESAMKEFRLGPRQWAFVVVAGGAVLALPFVQSQSVEPPAPSAVDAEADLLPTTAFLPHANSSANSTSVSTASADTGTAKADAPPLPKWPGMKHSPFDELVQGKVSIPDAAPKEEIVPMQPLRPWITAPNMTRQQKAEVITPSNQLNTAQTVANTKTPKSSTNSTSNSAPPSSPSKLNSSVAMSSPWRDEASPAVEPVSTEQTSAQVVASYGHGRRNLPVTAGPADQYTPEEIAAKLNLPKPELSSQDPRSAVVSPEALAQSITQPKSSVVLSRQPISRPVGVQVRFGQAHAAGDTPAPTGMTPLPKLPDERRNHVIYQPSFK